MLVVVIVFLGGYVSLCVWVERRGGGILSTDGEVRARHDALQPAEAAANGHGAGPAAAGARAGARARDLLVDGGVDGVADAGDDEDGGAEGEGPGSEPVVSLGPFWLGDGDVGLRILVPVHVVVHGQQHAGDSDERAELQHGPRGPVQGHEVLAVAELQGHEDKNFHDDGGERDDEVGEALVQATVHAAAVGARAGLEVLGFVMVAVVGRGVLAGGWHRGGGANGKMGTDLLYL